MCAMLRRKAGRRGVWQCVAVQGKVAGLQKERGRRQESGAVSMVCVVAGGAVEGM